MGRGMITEKQSEEIRKLHAEGYTKRQLTEKFNVSETCIHNHIKGRVGKATKSSGKRLSVEDVFNIRKLRSQGKTLEELAEMFECSSSTILLKTKDIKVDRAAGTLANQIRELLRAGKGVSEIAATLKCNSDYVNRLNMALEKREPRKISKFNYSEEVEKQMQILKEQRALREKELEELRQQEIKDFRWGGTVKIC